MYETHFGLKKRPFRALATGSDVFVGPQTAATMSGLKKALAAPDAIVAVSGPVGVGKSAQVRRALDAFSKKPCIVSVGRMQLGHDEVLELLLEEMGASLPAGTVQRFTTFRRLLKEQAEQGSQIVVVVEDATRIGADALSELEALTATDAGVSDGANIVLMGDEELQQVLNAPKLTRLKQRLRLRHSIAPFSASELTGYLKHCFRLAGREYDTLFPEGSAALLHDLSGGIPRMTNNLVESVLTAAADAKAETVSIELISRVAGDEYGLEVSRAETNETPVADKPQPVMPAATTPPVETPAVSAAPVEPDQAEPPATDADEEEIPELIQDTLPDLAVLAPGLADAPVSSEPAVPDAAIVPEPAATGPAPKVAAQTDTDPELAAALEAAQVVAPDEDVPEWERDPTLAELRPDLDALEHAMAVAQGLAPGSGDEPEQSAGDEEPAEPVPEITLDREIQAKIEEATELLKQAEEEEKKKAQAEAEEAGIDDRSVAEILADANEAEKEDKNSIESQLDATDAFALNKIEAVAAAEKAAEAAAEEPELPVLEPHEPPVAKAPPEPPVAKARPEPPAVARAPKPPVAKPPPEPPAVARAPEPPAVKTPPPEPPVLEAPEPSVVEASPATEEPPPADQAPPIALKKPDPELQKIASGLAAAKTLDDVDDKMAETLFGEEFSLMAAEIAAHGPPELPANDDLELALEESAKMLVPDIESAAAVEIDPEAKAIEPEPEPKVDLQGGTPDLAATQQRLATVRALNAGSKPASPPLNHIVMTEETAAAPAPTDDHPEPIEEQISTSITQTLKALSVRPPPVVQDDDDDDDERKSGFFSRFRRS